jgi:hypothetical protein
MDMIKMNKKIIFTSFILFLFLNTSIYSAETNFFDVNSKEGHVAITNDNSDYTTRYALIVLGRSKPEEENDYSSHTKHLQSVYDTLTEYYGFEDDNIEILFRKQDLETDNPDFIDFVLGRDQTYDSTEDVLIQRLDSFKTKVNSDDLFVFCAIAHGGYGFINDEYKKHSYFNCFSGTVQDNELQNYMSGMKGFKTFFIHSCYSGGFIEYLSSNNRIVMTACTNETKTYTWIGDLCEGLKGHADHSTPDGGGNNNGLVDMDEAFRYPYDRNNLLDDNQDKIGHNWEDDGYQPGTSGQDGNISASTTLGKMNLISYVTFPSGEIRPGEEVEFESWAVGGCGAPYNYHWDFDDGSSSNNQNPAHIFTDFGTYNVVLTVKDSCGGEISYEKTISIDKKTDIKADGIIYFENVDEKINTSLQGSFTFENVGDQGTELDWSLEAQTDNSYTIIFSQENGNNLKPSDGKITIDYEIVVETHPWTYLNHDVKIIDVNNPDEYEEVRLLLVDGESELDITENNLPNGNEKFDPGAEISGSFTVENKNPSMTFLEWEIESWPTWGEWNFSNLSGEDNVEVEVTFVLPADKKDSFSGEIRVSNINNEGDYKDISISLVTSNAKTFDGSIFEKLLLNNPFLSKFFQLIQDLIII